MQKELCVLVVENDVERAATFMEVVDIMGGCQSILYAANAAEAIRILNGEDEDLHMPELVIMSLHLPGDDAFNLLDYRHSNDHLHTIPFNAFFRATDESQVNQAYEKRANCCIPVPSDQAQQVEIFARTWEYWSNTVSHAAAASLHAGLAYSW